MSCFSIYSRASFLWEWGWRWRGWRGVSNQPGEQKQPPSQRSFKFLLAKVAPLQVGYSKLLAPASLHAHPARLPDSPPSRPGHCGGLCPAGAPGATQRRRRQLQKAWRAAARGCAPVCVQSGSAGCAPSRAAMRKQTLWQLLRPLGALSPRPSPSPPPPPPSPRARLLSCSPSHPAPPTATLPPRGHPDPRPRSSRPATRPCSAPARAGCSPTAPRARARAPRAPCGPPGTWPPES